MIVVAACHPYRDRRCPCILGVTGNSDIGATGSSAALRHPLIAGHSMFAGSRKGVKTKRPRWAGPCRWRRCWAEWLSLCRHAGADFDGAGAAGCHGFGVTGFRRMPRSCMWRLRLSPEPHRSTGGLCYGLLVFISVPSAASLFPSHGVTAITASAGVYASIALCV